MSDDNHEYDGITEYDNPMPGWWKATFWATFVFSLGYLFHYVVAGKGESVAEAYAAYETRIFGPDRVKIQGRLAGLYRRYH